MECVIDNIDISISHKKMKQMIFIMNCLENGWTVKQRGEKFVFKKKHENKEEIYDDNFIDKFVSENSNITQILEHMGLE